MFVGLMSAAIFGFKSRDFLGLGAAAILGFKSRDF